MSPLRPLLHFLCQALLLPTITADPVCNKSSVYRAIQRLPSGTGTIFCSEYLATKTYQIPRQHSLHPRPSNRNRLFIHRPSHHLQNERHQTHIITTSYSSQERAANASITQPLPSYIEQYPTSRVRSACSSIVPTPVQNTYYIPCDGSEASTIFYCNTFTTGKPGKKRVTSKSTETTTKSPNSPSPPPAPRPTTSTT